MQKDDAYVSFMDRFMRGEAPSEEEFLFHFEHQNGLPADALAVGATVPAFGLPDQDGVSRSFADLAGPAGLLVVFARSAHWCPYCRNQLAELNVQLDRIRAAGYNIVAITSDVPERIREFCAQHDIGYPILADPEAVAIAAFGVRNDDIPRNRLQGGVAMPHPGHFLIAADGRVLAREFTGDIRHRVSATTLIAESDDAAEGGVTLATPELSARIALSATQVYGGQEIAVTARISAAPDVHVYGAETAPPYVPLSLAFAEDGLLDEQRFRYPPAEMLQLDATGETLPVLSGAFTIRGRLRLRWSPPRSPFAELADFVSARAIPPGTYALEGVLRYQACSGSLCLPPQALPFSLPIEVRPNARAGAPVKFGDFEIPPPTD